MAKEYRSNNKVADNKVAELRVQVDDIRSVMSDNVLKILERGERLQNLDSRADALHASSQEFQTTARRMQNKMWWDNMKWVLILGFMGLLILLFIYASIVY
uniref:V-SNARE coiled-coil homology domain-containing protein n=1 Tax=Ditylenchus dipsaci TaxID=166011 RepID=A0A915DRL9_9BILA